MRPGHQRALLMGIVGGVQHQRPIESAHAIFPESAGADRPYDRFEILKNQVSEQSVPKLFAHFDEMLPVKYSTF